MTKILVVDDNEQNLYLLQMLLGGSGYEVVTAADGAEALEQAGSDPPALIVSDILMPVMDGFTLCRRWKADERLRRIPFIFYTATYTDARDEEFALNLGADRFVRKPAEPDVLLGVLQDVVDRIAKGGRTATPSSTIGETVHLRQYNEILLHKLEDKMVELEQANLRLEQRVADRTAELEERNQTLEAFAFSMAHDLGAPLRGIRGFAGILKSDESDALSEAGRQNLDVIIESTDRLQQMMSDLLRYATMGSGGLGIGAVKLANVLQRVRSNLSTLLNETGAELIVANDLPTVQGESTLLNQVFSNLVKNAVTYRRPDVTPRVEVLCDEHGERVVVGVRDNGIGIREKDRQQIFTLFQRLHSQEEIPGSGVGLGVVDRAMRLLGGRVWVESEFGKGSTFFVELPIASAT